MPLFFNTKLLKIALPVTTLTAATIITATLLFSNREDLKLTSLNDEALENYDKELDPYKEEPVKQEEEQETHEKSKSDDSKEPKNQVNEEQQVGKEQTEKETENKKSLEELIKRRMDGVDNKKYAEKLLNNPEELLKDILKGEEMKPSEEEVQQFLKRAPELAKELQNNKQENQEPEVGPSQERMEGAGKPKPPLEDEDLSRQDSEGPNHLEENEIGEESQMLSEDSPEEDTEKSDTPPLKSEALEPSSAEEKREEASPHDEEETPSATTSEKESASEILRDAERDRLSKGGSEDHLEEKSALEEGAEEQEDLAGRSTNEEGSEESSLGEQDSESSLGTESEGRQDGNEGGNATDTQYDMETLTSLRSQLGDAIFLLGIKLR